MTSQTLISWIPIPYTCLPDKSAECERLRQHLTDVSAGVEQRVIDVGLDHWRRCFHACIGATWGHFDYLLWHKLVRTSWTAIY